MQQKLLYPIVLTALALVAWLGDTFGTKWVVMSIIGFGLGFTLSFCRFGIVFGWKEMLTQRNSYYVRIHLLTIAIEILLFTACLSFSHAVFGDKMTGNIMVINVPFVIGAFIFGIGMQLAGVAHPEHFIVVEKGDPNRRSIAETAVYRIKHLFGDSLTLDAYDSRVAEVLAMTLALN